MTFPRSAPGTYCRHSPCRPVAGSENSENTLTMWSGSTCRSARSSSTPEERRYLTGGTRGKGRDLAPLRRERLSPPLAAEQGGSLAVHGHAKGSGELGGVLVARRGDNLSSARPLSF